MTFVCVVITFGSFILYHSWFFYFQITFGSFILYHSWFFYFQIYYFWFSFSIS